MKRPFILSLVLFGCSSSESEPPQPICRGVTSPRDANVWFTEVTDEVGLGKTSTLEPLATSVVTGDLDGDGYQDLLAAVFPAQRQTATSARMRFVFMNRPSADDPKRRVFVDATDASGLMVTRDGVGGRGWSISSLGDIDNDGDLDIVACPGSGEIGSVLDSCAAFLNDGRAHFTLATKSALEDEVFWVPSSVMLDYDKDGILDFWPGTVGQWAYGPALTTRPHIFKGVGDGTFTDVSAQLGMPSNPTADGHLRINFGVTSCDVDNDGWRDVLIGNYYVAPAFFYRFDGTRFTEVGAQTGVAGRGGHTNTITCGDLDDDGAVDLMRTTIRHPGNSSEPSALLFKRGGQFTSADPAQMGFARDEGSMEGDNTAVFPDIDLDGRKDLFVAGSNYPKQWASDESWTHDWLWRQTETGTFEDVTPKTPWGDALHQSGEGPAFVDIDNDGDLDLVVGTGAFNGEFSMIKNTLRVYRNDVGQDSNWTRVRVIGKGAGAANRSGIGAKVRVTAGGRTQYQEVLGSWGHSNTQNDVVLTFGLGDACEIEKLEVIWPDLAGSVSTFEHVGANYAIEVTQGEKTLKYLGR